MWPDFQKKHILDPRSISESTYAYWNRAQWNEWLRARLEDDYGHRDVDSVIVSHPQTILDDFKKHNFSYHEQEYWWSNEKYPMFILKKVYQNNQETFDYDVIDVGQMYVLVKLSAENEPIQFKGQFSERPLQGNINLNLVHYRKVL